MAPETHLSRWVFGGLSIRPFFSPLIKESWKRCTISPAGPKGGLSAYICSKCIFIRLWNINQTKPNQTLLNEMWNLPNLLLLLLTFQRSEIWQFSQVKKKRVQFRFFRGSNSDLLGDRQLCYPLHHSILLWRNVEKLEQIQIFVKFHSSEKLAKAARD